MVNLIEQWLIDRRQMVELDGEVSVVKEIPEISVLGHIFKIHQSCQIICLNVKKGKGSFFYIAQYPVRWTAQSALHFLPSLADLFIPTPTRLLQEAF